MTDIELNEPRISILFYDDYEGIDFYDLDDFLNINSKCPKCLNNCEPEYCSGCGGCYCGRGYHEFCEECKKPYHDYCDEYADKCPKCNGYICKNENCQYRFAIIKKIYD